MDSDKKVVQSKPGQKLRLNKPVTKVTLKRPAKYTCNAVLDPLTHEACEDQTDDPAKPHCGFKLSDADLFCPICGASNARLNRSAIMRSALKRHRIEGKKNSSKVWVWIVVLVVLIILNCIIRNISRNQRAEMDKMHEQAHAVIQKMIQNQKSNYYQRDAFPKGNSLFREKRDLFPRGNPL